MADTVLSASGGRSKRIEELDIVKGFVAFLVVAGHIRSVANISEYLGPYPMIRKSLGTLFMMLFFVLSGYIYRNKEGILPTALKRTKRLILPYYKACVFFLITFAIIHVVIQKHTIAWFMDGTLGILFHLQAFHFFDKTSSGVHEMFYCGLANWFFFQMAVSFFVFIPVSRLEDKIKEIWKPIITLILLAIGALFYHLDLQELNGKFFPPVCKIFILPNIFGFAGLINLGYWVKSIKLFDFDKYNLTRLIILFAVSLCLIVVYVRLDDHIYDLPIGKWGSFKELSFFISPIASVAVIFVLGVLSKLVKKISLLKNALIYMANKSLEFILYQFFVSELIAMAGGYWVPYLTEKYPVFTAAESFLHYITNLVVTILFIYANQKVLDILRNKKIRAANPIAK